MFRTLNFRVVFPWNEVISPVAVSNPIFIGGTDPSDEGFILMENIYVQFEGMDYQQRAGIPIGTNCAPLIADVLFCYETDFMSNLQKFKQYDLIEMFNDTSQYFDDIFTIANPEFEKRNIFQIYIPWNFLWTKQILQTKKLLSLI